MELKKKEYRKKFAHMLTEQQTKDNKVALDEIKKKFPTWLELDDRCCHHDKPLVDASGGHAHSKTIPPCEKHKNYRI